MSKVVIEFDTQNSREVLDVLLMADAILSRLNERIENAKKVSNVELAQENGTVAKV